MIADAVVPSPSSAASPSCPDSRPASPSPTRPTTCSWRGWRWSPGCSAWRSRPSSTRPRTSATSCGGADPSGRGPPLVACCSVRRLLLAIPQLYGVGYPVMDQATGGWLRTVVPHPAGVRGDPRDQPDARHRRFRRDLRAVPVHRGHRRLRLRRHREPRHRACCWAARPVRGGRHGRGLRRRHPRSAHPALASVVEMSGDFALTLPVMLAVAIAAVLSRAISYGTIYTGEAAPPRYRPRRGAGRRDRRRLGCRSVTAKELKVKFGLSDGPLVPASGR